MALLTDDEQAAVLRYYQLKDAKMALCSALLKRFIVAKHLAGKQGLGWETCKATRDEHTKPVFYLPGSKEQPVLFNVSHQAGLVILFATLDAPTGTQIGVDVVCPGERRKRDHESIRTEGWPEYVRVHDSVFSPGEASRLTAVQGSVDEKLGYFYALWCIREAYVKMTGEALLASWLKELDVRGFAAPGEPGIGEPGREKGGALEVWFKGSKVDDAEVKMEWEFGKEFMVCTAVRRAGEGITVGKFEKVDLDTILEEAERIRTAHP